MLITLRDIHKHYGAVRANDGISMEIAEGSIHGILGENGAGKSTLMKVLAGFARKTSGSILLDGRAADYNPAGNWNVVSGPPGLSVPFGSGEFHDGTFRGGFQ